MTQRITRRAVLIAGVPPLLGAVVTPPQRKSRPLPSVGEFVRFVDPTTESTIVRLTSPASASYLPAAGNRFVSLRERFLVFSSDRTGSPTPFSLDLRTGTLRPLAVTPHLNSRSLCLDAAGRMLYFIDGTDLKQLTLANKKLEVLSEGVSAFSVGASPSDILVVREGRLEHLGLNAATLASAVAPWCALRPGGTGCAFARISMDPSTANAGTQEFWYLPLAAAAQGRPVLLAEGRISNPLWSPDGASLMFLRQVPGRGGAWLTEIHEVSPDTAVEQTIALTSQFASFAPNADASVFVGASASRAQPTVIVLLRSTRREFTLCEHRAKQPASVSPVFSPDSRRVYFESDHQGNSALDSVKVELLIEPTGASAS